MRRLSRGNSTVMTNQPCLSVALWLAFALGLPGIALAEATDSLDATRACLARRLDSAPAEITVGALRQACAKELAAQAAPVVEVEESLAAQRVKRESQFEQNPFALAAYKQNYILPYSYVTEQNPIYNAAGLEVNHEEAKFQFSFRFPLSSRELFVKGDSLDIGYTQVSFWQLYNSASAPFRETNYDPEIFYTRPLNFRPRGADTALRFGLEHESNGRGIVNGYSLSRSWNRVYAKLIYAKDDYVIAFRPWYRIPERAKTSPTDSGGDDNPDIEKYMGYFDLTGAWQIKSFEFSVLARDNLRSSHNLGAIELGMSFPLYRQIRGYAQYFNGYGESLIDYNHSINRVGVGFLLTEIL
jgi:phospholipase A1/A2